MTIRRLLVSIGLSLVLFFYSLLKDKDSNHWIETAFAMGAEYRIDRGSPPCRATSASPVNAWVL
jgi:hypothetical protein